MGIKPANLRNLTRHPERYFVMLYKVLAITKSLTSPRYAKLKTRLRGYGDTTKSRSWKKYSGIGRRHRGCLITKICKCCKWKVSKRKAEWMASESWFGLRNVVKISRQQVAASKTLLDEEGNQQYVQLADCFMPERGIIRRSVASSIVFRYITIKAGCRGGKKTLSALKLKARSPGLGQEAYCFQAFDFKKVQAQER